MSTRSLAIELVAVVASLLVLFGLATTARAQPEGAEQHVEDAPAERPPEDVTKWQLSLGGVMQTGNTQSYQANGGSLFQLVRGPHGFTAEAQGAFGRAVPEEAEEDEFVDTARNLRFRLRYDFFFTDLDALFVAAQLRHDPFAGLDYRAQGQLGYARYFVRQEKLQLWAEIGYDLTYDNYHPDPLVIDGMTIDGTEVLHSARLFVGYVNDLNDNVQVRTGLEALFNVQDASDVRLNWDSALTAKLVDRLQLEVKLLVLWDHEPVPGNRPLDTTTQLNLIYTLI